MVPFNGGRQSWENPSIDGCIVSQSARIVPGMGARPMRPTIVVVGSFESDDAPSAVVDDASGPSATHDAAVIDEYRGRVVATQAATLAAVFADAQDAAAWAAETRMSPHPSIARASWGFDAVDDPSTQIGERSWRRAFRIVSVATPTQMVLSRAAADVLARRLPSGLRIEDRGDIRPLDLGRPERILELVGPDEGSPLPLCSLDAVPNNLPIQPTSFVGRGREVRELKRMVLDHHLLTLTGPGGCGKTRLALQLAATISGRFPDGVWVVDFAALTDPSLVFAEIAEAIGADITRQGAERTVAESLSRARSMLVLDNCEHLVDASAAAVERLVSLCPLLTILVTSREPLGARGETTWRVPSLSIPPPHFEPGDIRASEAARLFVERAEAVRSSFRLDEGSAAAVAEICRRLDGIPLAIELAAARCRAFPPSVIADQLGERFDLLTGGRSASLSRHQTLEASFEWSYALLDEVQRVLFRRLSIFVGGFDLAAAEAVAGFEPLERWSVFDALTALVDKSLVVAVDEHRGGRFSLLETMRQFAMSKLIGAGEVRELRQLHAEYYAGLTEEVAPGLEGPSMANALASLETEIENLRCALDWWTQQGEAERATRMNAKLGFFWTFRPKEGTARIRAALALEGAEPESRAWALLVLAHLVFYRGDVASAAALAGEALEAGKHAQDERAIGRALTTTAKCRPLMSESQGLLELFEDALKRHRATGDDYFRVYSLSWRILAALQFGHGDLVRATVDEMLSVGRSAGNPQMAVQALVLASAAAYFLGDVAATLERSEAALQIASEIRNEIAVTLARGMIARVRGLHGEYDDASSDAAEAAARSQAIANVFGVAVATWADALNRSDQGDSAAVELAERAHRLMGFLADGGFVFACELAPAAVRSLLSAGHADRATELVGELTERAARAELAGGRARLAFARALLALHAGDVPAARGAAFEALDEVAAMPSRLLMVAVVELLAHTAALTRRWAESARLYAAAAAERCRLGVRVPPADRRWHDEDFAAAAEALGTDALTAARAEAAEMDLEAAAAYARRGRGSRRRAVTGWSSLTPAEVEVARLVAEGLRNAQIAGKLFVTEATVKTHLVHIYAKLGVGNRAELTAMVLNH